MPLSGIKRQGGRFPRREIWNREPQPFSFLRKSEKKTICYALVLKLDAITWTY
jgi:hypothetical protein